MTKKKRGRPPLEPGKAKENRVILRLTDKEKALFEARAKAKGLTLSAWARLILNQAKE